MHNDPILDPTPDPWRDDNVWPDLEWSGWARLLIWLVRVEKQARRINPGVFVVLLLDLLLVLVVIFLTAPGR